MARRSTRQRSHKDPEGTTPDSELRLLSEPIQYPTVKAENPSYWEAASRVRLLLREISPRYEPWPLESAKSSSAPPSNPLRPAVTQMDSTLLSSSLKRPFSSLDRFSGNDENHQAPKRRPDSDALQDAGFLVHFAYAAPARGRSEQRGPIDYSRPNLQSQQNMPEVPAISSEPLLVPDTEAKRSRPASFSTSESQSSPSGPSSPLTPVSCSTPKQPPSPALPPQHARNSPPILPLASSPQHKSTQEHPAIPDTPSQTVPPIPSLQQESISSASQYHPQDVPPIPQNPPPSAYPMPQDRIQDNPSNKHSCQSMFYDAVNQEQRDLLKDPRVKALRQRFQRVQDTEPNTFYGAYAPIGIHILDKASPAQTDVDPGKADYLIGNSLELEKYLIDGRGDKCFVLRDSDWLHTRPQITGPAYLQDLKITATNQRDMQVEVQMLGKDMGTTGLHSVENMHIDEVIETFSKPNLSKGPINLLSLMSREDNVIPWPLAKHCNLLNKAAGSVASAANVYHRTQVVTTASKVSTEIMSRAIDLQSCMRFMIYGQQGAISSWHMDSLGPYTHVTLEPNAEGKPAHDVLKLWAYVRTDHLSEKERTDILKKFKVDGLYFYPDPKNIRVLSLTAGDTLIMPPGTIHAPITVTDCLFRGGMVMQQRQMRRSLQSWRFCSDNAICTNEDQPKQARAILDYFRALVVADPSSCGFGHEGGLKEFEDNWSEIGGNSLNCRCATSCTNRSRCGCASMMQRCGSKCHKGGLTCKNPLGCEGGVLGLDEVIHGDVATAGLKTESLLEQDGKLAGPATSNDDSMTQ